MTLRVPLGKAKVSGLRKLSSRKEMDAALAKLRGRSRAKRTMWSRRAQEYQAKIASGDPASIAEVVRDLYRNAGQPEQSYSERQIYQAALDRLVREFAAVERIDEMHGDPAGRAAADGLTAGELSGRRAGARMCEGRWAQCEAVGPVAASAPARLGGRRDPRRGARGWPGCTTGSRERFADGDRVVYLGNYLGHGERGRRRRRRAARFPPPRPGRAGTALPATSSILRGAPGRDVAKAAAAAIRRQSRRGAGLDGASRASRRRCAPMAASCAKALRRRATGRARSPAGPAALRTAMNAAPGHTTLFAVAAPRRVHRRQRPALRPCRGRSAARRWPRRATRSGGATRDILELTGRSPASAASCAASTASARGLVEREFAVSRRCRRAAAAASLAGGCLRLGRHGSVQDSSIDGPTRLRSPCSRRRPADRCRSRSSPRRWREIPRRRRSRPAGRGGPADALRPVSRCAASNEP